MSHLFRHAIKALLMTKPMTFVNLLMVFIIMPSFFYAQEKELGPKFPDGVEEAVYFYRKAVPRQLSQSRIDPPNWWVGMQNPFLQLLVHDNNIGLCDSLQIDYDGLKVQGIHKVENPNYLFIDLLIEPGTNAGNFDIVLFFGEDEKAFNYSLLPRQKAGERSNGVDASDLIYLIMPDRFANGDRSNDSDKELLQQGVDRDNVFFRHGGDLIGVMEHLDYLENLGVTALWLNPVFENNQPYESYHGYALTDHYKIDKRLGSNEQYLQLVKLCHERGIKVVMDIVHNHVGDQHWFIQDLPMENWIHQPDTFVKTTYRSTTLMDPYAAGADRARMLDGWFDNHMPDLNQQNPFVANYLIQNNIWWMEYSGQNTFRIDTYAYNDQDFMADWGARIKAEYPERSFFGEVWDHGLAIQAQFTADNHPREGWNSNLPGVTDYLLYYAINEALTEEQSWTGGITRVYYTLAQDFLYKDPYHNVIFLDNHDLARVFTNLEEDVQALKSGLAMLLTMRGTPMLYYGTEILLDGKGGAFGEAGRRDFPGGWKGDPQNKFKEKGRTAMEQEVFEYVSRLANYRKENPVLQTGKLMQFVPEDGIYVYFRYNADKTIMVVYNASISRKSINTSRFEERMNGFERAKNIITEAYIDDLSTISLDARSIAVLELITE
jgi:glycosidase